MKVFTLKARHRNRCGAGPRTVIGIVATYRVIVDDEDACFLRSYPWSILRGTNGTPYVRRKGLNGDDILLHKVVLGLPSGDETKIHFVNGNSLDCRKQNLATMPLPMPKEVA